MIRVAIVDDHAMVREGLSLLVSGQPDLELLGTYPDGEAFLTKMAVLSESELPIVVLMDLAMPGAGGVATTAVVTSDWPGVAVVVLTTFGDAERVLAALDAGAVGYLMKDSASDQVVAGVRTAAEGGSPLDPRVARTLLDVRRRAVSSTVGPALADVHLTEKQRAVLILVAEGLSNRLVASRLGISEKTVKTHLTAVYAALAVTDRLQAALWARDHLLAPNEA